MEISKYSYFNQFKCIVFDFDGVIIDSVMAKGKCLYEIFSIKSKSIQNQVIEHHLDNPSKNRQDKIRFIANVILNLNLEEDQCIKYIEKFDTMYLSRVPELNVIMGIHDFLEFTSQYSNVYINSAARKHEIEKILIENISK